MNWTNINDEIFRKLAFLYAKDMHKYYNWTFTGCSLNGNNDANVKDIKLIRKGYHYE